MMGPIVVRETERNTELLTTPVAAQTSWPTVCIWEAGRRNP